MPRITYGPPGARGVTTLMAVGDNETDAHGCRPVMIAAVATWAVGAVSGSSTLKNLGIGAAIALFAARRLVQKAAVTTAPAPAPAAGLGVWFVA